MAIYYMLRIISRIDIGYLARLEHSNMAGCLHILPFLSREMFMINMDFFV
jgi:hypothetical protein